MTRSLLTATLITLLAALAAPTAEAGNQSAQFGVSLRLVAATAIPTAAPNLPMPADSHLLATAGTSSFHVMTGGVDASRDYFLATMPTAGYALQAQSLDGGRWQSLWRDAAGSCTAILAEPVVGAAVARVKSSSVVCA